MLVFAGGGSQWARATALDIRAVKWTCAGAVATAGILTLLGDFGKGWVCAWVAMHWLTVESYIMVVAFVPILGHMFSPFLGFKGGKGVATAVGVVLGLSPSIGLLLLLIWLGAVAIWRYSSGGALAAFGCFPIVAVVNEQRQEFFIFSLVISALIWIKHKDNIVRLWRGTESKMGKNKEILEE